MNNNSSTKELDLSNNERLFIEGQSLFKPNKNTNLKHKGFKIFTFHAGFKKKFHDLLIIIFDKTVQVASAYSKTSMPSAPIIWDKKNNSGKAKALIVNSGNANAHTGEKGLKIIDAYVEELLNKINCKKNEVLVSSTGIIGELFDPKKIINQIKKINYKKNSTIIDAAKTIMTTDTYPKILVKKLTIDGKSFKIYAIAKGSGMIMPNMGTMLVYIFIEAEIQITVLRKLIKNNIDDTFNSISVDSDTSTSDTLFLFSLNQTKINLNNSKNIKILNSSIFNLMKDLSLQVVKDGEGISKLITVNVLKCKTKQQGKNIGFSIVNSPLVKTAIAGKDANWGRIIMAIGKSGENIFQNKIKIYFGNYLVCKNGSIYKNINLVQLNKYMKKKVIELNIHVNTGNRKCTVYGNDLTYKYVKINADYRS